MVGTVTVAELLWSVPEEMRKDKTTQHLEGKGVLKDNLEDKVTNWILC